MNGNVELPVTVSQQEHTIQNGGCKRVEVMTYMHDIRATAQDSLQILPRGAARTTGKRQEIDADRIQQYARGGTA